MHELVTESFQMNTEHLRQVGDADLFDAITQLLTAVTAVHVLAGEFVCGEECRQAVFQTDDITGEHRPPRQRHIDSEWVQDGQ